MAPDEIGREDGATILFLFEEAFEAGARGRDDQSTMFDSLRDGFRDAAVEKANAEDLLGGGRRRDFHWHNVGQNADN